MRNIFFITFLSVMILSCGKKIQKDFYFYQLKSDSFNATLNLHIDNELKGVLPKLKHKFNCDSTEIKSQAIHLILSEGKHTIECKDSLGVIQINGYHKFSKNSSGGGGNKGGMESLSKHDCTVIRIFSTQ